MPCFDIALDVVTVMSSSLGIWAALNTTYRCNSPASFNVGGVTVTFRNMRLEAYMPGNDLSPTGTGPIVPAVRPSGFSVTALDTITRNYKHVSSQRTSAWRTRPLPRRHLQPPPVLQRPRPLRRRLLRERLTVACTPSRTAMAPCASWLIWVCSSTCPIFHFLRIR